MPTIQQPTPAVVKKLQTLAQIAADLRQGQHFNITRLTVIKSFCSDSDAAAKFAVHIAKLAQRQFEGRRRGGTKPTKWQQYKQLIAAAIPAMARYLKLPSAPCKGVGFSWV